MYFFNETKRGDFLLITLTVIVTFFMDIISCPTAKANEFFEILEKNEVLQRDLEKIYNDLPQGSKKTEASPRQTMEIFAENFFKMINDARGFPFLTIGHAYLLGHMEDSKRSLHEHITIVTSSFLEGCFEGCTCPPSFTRGFKPIGKENKVSHIYQQTFVKHAHFILHSISLYATLFKHTISTQIDFFLKAGDTEIIDGKTKLEHIKTAQNINALLRGLECQNLLYIPRLNTILKTRGLSKIELDSCITFSTTDSLDENINVNFTELQRLALNIIYNYTAAESEENSLNRKSSTPNINIFSIRDLNKHVTTFNKMDDPSIETNTDTNDNNNTKNICEHLEMIATFLNEINSFKTQEHDTYTMSKETFISIWHSASKAYGDNMRNNQLGFDLCGMVLYAASMSTCQNTFIDLLIQYDQICKNMDKNLSMLDDKENIEKRFYCCIKSAHQTPISSQGSFLHQKDQNKLMDEEEKSIIMDEEGEVESILMDEEGEEKSLIMDDDTESIAYLSELKTLKTSDDEFIPIDITQELNIPENKKNMKMDEAKEDAVITENNISMNKVSASFENKNETNASKTISLNILPYKRQLMFKPFSSTIKCPDDREKGIFYEIYDSTF